MGYAWLPRRCGRILRAHLSATAAADRSEVVSARREAGTDGEEGRHANGRDAQRYEWRSRARRRPSRRRVGDQHAIEAVSDGWRRGRGHVLHGHPFAAAGALATRRYGGRAARLAGTHWAGPS